MTDTETCALFDDRLAPPGERRSLALGGLAAVLRARTAAGADRLLARVERETAAGRFVALVAEYELGALYEPAAGAAHRCAPLAAYVFAQAEPLDAAGADRWIARRLAAAGSAGRPCGVAALRRGLSRPRYLAAVEAVREAIAAGEVYQVNVTYPLRFTAFGDPLALYARLRERQPVAHGAFLQLPERTILSLSPELFLERRGADLVSRPMKGTAARGRGAADDARRIAALAASEKDRAENVMIVDLIRNDLGRIARPGSVRVERLCAVETYPTLHQMVSTVAADAQGVPLAAVFRALFPCGSITGAPKIAAMRRIAALEAGPRGAYTGAIGYAGPRGALRLNVAIRTAVLDRRGRGTTGIGGGIVIDSDPALEQAECELKGAWLTRLDPGFGLVETMRGIAFVRPTIPLLGFHLRRLARSAAHFGFRCDLRAIRAALAAHLRAGPRGVVLRVRLELAHGGALAVSVEPFEAAACDGLPRLVLAPQRIDTRDPLVRHKTTDRAVYDAAWDAVSGTPRAFDALLLNERGTVAQGARTNVYAAFGTRLCTPPLSDGALDGVMRRALLVRNKGRVTERSLSLDDLARADAVYAGNALRGLIEVEWSGVERYDATRGRREASVSTSSRSKNIWLGGGWG